MSYLLLQVIGPKKGRTSWVQVEATTLFFCQSVVGTKVELARQSTVVFNAIDVGVMWDYCVTHALLVGGEYS